MQEEEGATPTRSQLDLVVVEPSEPPKADRIRDVFAHYRTHHPRAFRNPQPSSKEWRAIEARIDEGYTVDDLRDAIDGCHAHPHNAGENDRGRPYTGLELIMRTGSQVERFAEEKRTPSRAVLTSEEMKGQRASAAWIARKRESKYAARSPSPRGDSHTVPMPWSTPPAESEDARC